jgi:hypothetical protein
LADHRESARQSAQGRLSRPLGLPRNSARCNRKITQHGVATVRRRRLDLSP